MSMSYFDRQAATYAEFRPDYPDDLFRYVGSLAANHRCAWDCGTGNGQAASRLAQYFDRVIATDISAEQITHARRQPNIEYRVAAAESSGIADRSVDVVMVSQALHWFDRPRFFAEARRVLAPGGALVVTVYGDAHIDSQTSSGAQLDAILQRFSKDFMRDYWPADRKLVDDLYSRIEFPFPLLPAPEIALTRRWSLPQLAGYLRSWSSTMRYIERHGGDPVAEVEREMRPLWQNPDTPMTITWPFRVFAGRFDFVS
jgi:SAM-dependent methyltransferase